MRGIGLGLALWREGRGGREERGGGRGGGEGGEDVEVDGVSRNL